MKQASCIITAVFLMLNFGSRLYAQFGFKLNAESGYSVEKKSNTAASEDLQLRMLGEIQYEFSGEESQFYTGFSFRPELYGLEKKIKSFRMKAAAGYTRSFETGNWGVSVNARRDIFNNFSEPVYRDILGIQGLYSTSTSEDIEVDISPGFAAQVLKYENNQSRNTYFLDAGVKKALFDYTEGFAGLYGEFFTINEKYTKGLLEHRLSTTGWKTGPQLNLSYSGTGILSLQYRLLFVSSDYNIFPSYEQLIRFTAGTLLGSDWSVFLLADYYNYKERIRGGKPAAEVLLYSPTNLENRILLKFGYDLNEGVEIYSRMGYSKEDIIDTFSFSDWSIMLGIEIRNQ